MLPDVSKDEVFNEVHIGELMRRKRGDEPLIKRLFDIYLEETPRLLGELEVALAAKNEEQAYDAIHQMKGSAGAMGAYRVHKTTEAALHLCKGGAVFGVENLIEAIKSETDLYIRNLTSVMKEPA